LEQVFTDQLGILKIVVRCVLLGKPEQKKETERATRSPFILIQDPSFMM